MMNHSSNASIGLDEIFDREIKELRWLAEVIVGDEQTAESCIEIARSRANGSSYVAPDWRVLWIKRCVAREAVESRRPEIAQSRASRQPSALNCAVAWGKTALRGLHPADICQVLNAFERAALILHVYLGFSVHDCALLLDCHWSSIEPACSAAMLQLLGPGLPACQEPVAARPLGGVA